MLQASIFKQDFLAERKDRESSYGRLTDLKDQSAAEVIRLMTRIGKLEIEKAGVDRAFQQLQKGLSDLSESNDSLQEADGYW